MSVRTAELSFEPRVERADFAAYAVANGRTSEEQRAHDREHYPGRHSTPFILWTLARRREFNAARGFSDRKGWSETQRTAFVVWLEVRARELAAERA